MSVKFELSCTVVLGDIEIYLSVLVTNNLSRYTGISSWHMTVVFGNFVSIYTTHSDT